MIGLKARLTTPTASKKRLSMSFLFFSGCCMSLASLKGSGIYIRWGWDHLNVSQALESIEAMFLNERRLEFVERRDALEDEMTAGELF